METPSVLVHRDLQSQNVMIVNGEPVFIDFQGMRLGSPFYDLGSLLYDPYVEIGEAERVALLKYYYDLTRPPMAGRSSGNFSSGLRAAPDAGPGSVRLSRPRTGEAPLSRAHPFRPGPPDRRGRPVGDPPAAPCPCPPLPRPHRQIAVLDTLSLKLITLFHE